MWHELTEHEVGTPVSCLNSQGVYICVLTEGVNQMDDWLNYIVSESREQVQNAWSRLCTELSPRRLVMVRKTSQKQSIVRLILHRRNSISPPGAAYRHRFGASHGSAACSAKLYF